ncbi:MAG: membrane protein insertion efficiency factor YidD [Verrucomicrobia bacterium]|jgi:uncharacterized protein|nr:membrane protein insertion efficiency factor YidD [Verrucomicrobiota bacterium]
MLVLCVQLYRWTLSPLKTFLFGPFSRCRFDPSCSQYALDALGAHGPFRGTLLSLGRICRCHPWGGCGADPVPPAALDQPCHTFQMEPSDSRVSRQTPARRNPSPVQF